MGVAGPIAIAKSVRKGSRAPAAEDKSLYVPRYLADARKARSTKHFVAQQLSKCGSTYFVTKLTLHVLGWGACVTAIALIVAIIFGAGHG